MDDIAIEQEALEHVFSDPSAEPIKLSYGLLRSVTEDFSSEIGHGGFGVVYMGYLGNGKVAVKKLSNPHALPDKQFLSEITCLKRAKHKNIIRFLGYCSETQGELLEFNGANVMAEVHTKLLCFEYVANGNIQQYLKQEKPRGDDWHVRYQMIRGICQGLHYLHENYINHLDLKPENIMLDAYMEPKVADFGLSRCLDQGQSKIITQNILGTPRYIAPEIIDKGEISLKSDIYALGIIIIELLTGINKIGLDSWDELLDMNCPRVRVCTEIARNCMDRDKQNRPTVREVIRDLDELENMIPRSSLNQVTRTAQAFRGTELLDVYPRVLRFPFVPNQGMQCHLAVTNKADSVVCFFIEPKGLDKYQGRYQGAVPPLSTAAITLSRDAEDELPSGTDTLVIKMLITGCDLEAFKQLTETKLCYYGDTLREILTVCGGKVYRAALKAVVTLVSPDDEQDVAMVDSTLQQEEEIINIDSMDVHPTEPWVLLVVGDTVYIWNWQTNEKIVKYNSAVGLSRDHTSMCDSLAKFVARKQWVVTGNFDGSILVHTCPAMDKVTEIKAHCDRVTSLTVHPSRPYLLSCGYPMSLKLWDWGHGWSCSRIFDVTSPPRQLMFDPKHTGTFATRHEDGLVKMWIIGHPFPIATAHTLGDYQGSDLFTYIGNRHFIASINGDAIYIWDLRKERHVYTLFIEGCPGNTVIVVSHPTRPIFVTVSYGGSIHIWDSLTYKFKKAYDNFPENPLHVGFTGLGRLVIGYKNGMISVINIGLE